MQGLKAAGARLLQLDVNDKDSCDKAIQQVIDESGRIDVLINNAGAGGLGALLEFDVDQANEVFKTNTLAPLRLSQLVARKSMVPRRSGLIVNIGSVVGEIPTAWAGIYSASKAALHSLSRVLEMELAGFGVQIMLVAAGGVKSGFGNAQLNSYAPASDSVYASVKDRILARGNQGQKTSIPNTVFAKRLADQILRSPARRPSYFSTGGLARLIAFFRWMPWFITRRVLMRFGGCELVGR